MSKQPRANESAILQAIRLAVGSLPDVRIWRNNVGMLKDHRGVPIRYGLAPGSADLIGIVAPHGRMLSIEVKAPGKLTRATPEQRNWERIVRDFGGVSGVVDSVEAALALIDEARQPCARRLFGVALSDSTPNPDGTHSVLVRVGPPLPADETQPRPEAQGSDDDREGDYCGPRPSPKRNG